MIRVMAKRYAKALIELAEEQKTAEKTRADLGAFVRVLDAQPDVEKLFKSPAVAPEDKKAVIREMAERLKLQPVTGRFIEYLAENSRIRHIREMHDAFENLLAERQNRIAVELTTASPVNNGYLAEIKKKLETVSGKNVDIKAQVDPSLIGGVRARMGSVVYDGSIKSQLDKMRSRLAQ